MSVRELMFPLILLQAKAGGKLVLCIMWNSLFPLILLQAKAGGVKELMEQLKVKLSKLISRIIPL
jgi:hypothetical protein